MNYADFANGNLEMTRVPAYLERIFNVHLEDNGGGQSSCSLFTAQIVDRAVVLIFKQEALFNHKFAKVSICMAAKHVTSVVLLTPTDNETRILFSYNQYSNLYCLTMRNSQYSIAVDAKHTVFNFNDDASETTYLNQSVIANGPLGWKSKTGLNIFFKCGVSYSPAVGYTFMDDIVLQSSRFEMAKFKLLRLKHLTLGGKTFIPPRHRLSSLLEFNAKGEPTWLLKERARNPRLRLEFCNISDAYSAYTFED